ncbi:MAG: o-succinylbenzoate synthase [Bacteroidaceae bacterium]|nr:o-succinylbenzoate synthase [Bacteroidaceae bacterium]MBQ4460628.1 o-succinylbenzoate synthase [Bacteroidaceae bacterium]
MKVTVRPYTLNFKQPAGTSRGIYTVRKVWYVEVRDGERLLGIGECAPLPKLSCDDIADYEDVLRAFAQRFEAELNTQNTDFCLGNELKEEMRQYPSMLFGFESAVMQMNAGGSTALSSTAFSRGERGITINGLIWMGTFDEMRHRIEEKMRLGYRCIKLKIGAIDFDNELSLIRMIRENFSAEQIEIRVDANGAFDDDAMLKLQLLAENHLHSIEQPIKAGQWQKMAELCAATPLPIALDEELIGINTQSEKIELLDTIRPQYIILKPSLHGGFCGAEEWIRLAEERGIGWWATSALESNVGLNAIAHWCAGLQESRPDKTPMPQGLGTGMLFTNNIDYPLHIEGERLYYKP